MLEKIQSTMPEANTHDSLPDQDNYILLEKACLLLAAADDLLTNDCHDLYLMIRDCGDPERQREMSIQLSMLNTGISEALSILKTLLYVDRATWNP